MKELNVVIVTQEEPFFLPAGLEKILTLDGIKVSRVIILDTGGALENRKLYLLKLFGFYSVSKIAFKYLKVKVINTLDKLFNYKLPVNKKSIEAVAKKNNVKLEVFNDINSDDSLRLIEKEAPDLLLSFSAPQAFRKELLDLPRYGVLNVHGSMLPAYRGIMPSFWVLANGKKKTGVTVHKMAAGIDEGEILLQREVDIKACTSVFEVIGKTKAEGVRLALDALKMYKENPDGLIFKENSLEEGSYYSWPCKEDVARFHERGYRFA